MILINDIRKDKIQAMKDRDSLKVNILRVIDSDATALAKKKENRDPTDTEVIKIIKSFIGHITETMDLLKDGINSKSKKNLQYEIEVLNSYMPNQLDESELTSIIKTMIEEDRNNASIGTIMKTLKEKHEGLYDGKMASNITRYALRR